MLLVFSWMTGPARENSFAGFVIDPVVFGGPLSV